MPTVYEIDTYEWPDGTILKFRDDRYDNLPNPMVYRGTLGTGGVITALPVNGTANVGDTYKVITAGTYAGVEADIGDMFTCLTKTSSANTWDHIPSGDEPAQTAAEVEYAHGTSGLVATNVQTAIDEVVADMKGTTEACAQFHLGFYLDENGGLCQVNEI